ncbi:putative protein [Arabidopsis thaliana]|uniref:Uncharacterized protein T14K23_120 n=1 Tax=Arabidopsis thaliana TaxID=3702 RepID=Q9M3F5_ARATH|nr:putative protein [Arabidopsis thaliana]
MGTIDYIRDFNLERTNWVLYVKILSLWNHLAVNNGEPTTMILCDENRCRIDARVPSRNYLYNFRSTLREGTWYYMADLLLKRATSTTKYSSFIYEIKFIWPTTMWRVSPRSTQISLQVIHSDEVEYEPDTYVNDKLNVVGIISSVSTFARFPYVYREGETDYEARYVKFTIRDNLITTCVAKGRACELFLIKFYRRIGLVTYNFEPIVAVVRFWRVHDFKGSNALFSEDGCSKLLIDPLFPDYDLQTYIGWNAYGDDEVVDGKIDYTFSDVHPRKTRWFVFVKLLRLWNWPPNYDGEEPTMILADEKGNKIDANSPLHVKKEVLISTLKEGQWYLLSHFEVAVANPLDRFSNHPLYRIKHASTVEKQFVVDAMGIIEAVSPIGKIPWSCDEFEKKWYKKISEINFKMEPVMIILRFWKMSEFQGNPCLISVGGCSKVYIDPNFRGLDKNTYLRNFAGSDDEDDDIFMETVESNF